MIQATTKLRVRYSETDQMGFVYYGNYAQYLEIGRVEALKTVGVSYRKLEEDGYGLPVKEMNIEYIRAALYDDELIISTTIHKKPSARVFFEYEIHRGEELLIKATTTLFFMDRSKRACRPPADFMKRMEAYFN
ncbi:MAG: acyl-CoA thioesterase [Flavobacteriales bacterium]|nr:acyl-CoA thioesterase [Flavobacteriales bacterium]